MKVIDPATLTMAEGELPAAYAEFPVVLEDAASGLRRMRGREAGTPPPAR